MVAEHVLKTDILSVVSTEATPPLTAVTPKVSNQIGRAISRITNYNNLDNKVCSPKASHPLFLATSCGLGRRGPLHQLWKMLYPTFFILSSVGFNSLRYDVQ
jgi:hypothetical protein